jgi:oligosaccharide reducing-end xylanase
VGVRLTVGAFFALSLLGACRTTVDSLGYDDARDAASDARVLHPLSGPASYPNAFRDVLGKNDTEIAARLEDFFSQLFHGNPNTEAIYFPAGPEQAFILDILHGDVRTEGIGYAMIIAVELDKRDEFDRLWRYAKAVPQYQSGPNRGYFLSSCDAASGTLPCVDPFGLEQFVMALLFANGLWGSDGAIDYGADALTWLDLMRQKEDQNGGVVDGVTNTFDGATKLVFDVPNTTAAGYTRPAVEMPGYYALWSQATGDPFWNEAAAAARAYWRRSANPTTGLLPTRATFGGMPVAGSDTFSSEGYRMQLNMVLDHVWFAAEPWEVDESNRLIAFFAGQGIDQYGRQYSLDGVTIDPLHDASLVAVNGATALLTTSSERFDFINAAWNLSVPTGPARYYTGLLNVLSFLILSGRFRVY